MDKKIGWSIFNKAISGEQIDCTPIDLYKFLTEELSLNISEFDKATKISISLLVPLVSKQWSGFDSIVDDETVKKQKFKEFLDYLVGSVKKILEESSELLSKHTKEDELALVIECPTNAVNTLICAARDNDIVFKNHQEIRWQQLTIDELINWPYVSVTFRNNDLMFTRNVSIDYQRYINYLRRNYATGQYVIVESAEQISATRSVIPCNILETYINEYLEVLRSLKLPAEKETEITIILQNFIKDIKLMNMQPPLQTIATGTKILIRISSEYVRNKKLSRPDHNRRIHDPKDIGFCEILTPKIQLLLNYFDGRLKTTEPASYGILENYQNENYKILPKIYYKCLFCNMEFVKNDTMQELLQHLYSQHKMEHQVRCISCKQAFELTRLAKCRWNHDCQKRTST